MRKIFFYFLISFYSFLITCCASIPKQKYLQKTSLENISSIYVIVTTSDLEVKYAREASTTESQFVLSLIFKPIIALPIEWAIRSAEDSNVSQALQDTSQSSRISNRLGYLFTSMLKEKQIFQKIDFKCVSKGENPIITNIYDAIVKIEIEEISLRRRYGDRLILFIQVTAQMKSINNAEILWDRNEIIESTESYQLEYFKQNGIPMLDKYLYKLAKRLSNEIIYAN